MVSDHPFFERQVFLNASESPSSEVHPRKRVHHDGAHSTPLHQKYRHTISSTNARTKSAQLHIQPKASKEKTVCKYCMVYWMACHHTTKDAILRPTAEARNFFLCGDWNHPRRECQSVTGNGETFTPALPGWCEDCLNAQISQRAIKRKQEKDEEDRAAVKARAINKG